MLKKKKAKCKALNYQRHRVTPQCLEGRSHGVAASCHLPKHILWLHHILQALEVIAAEPLQHLPLVLLQGCSSVAIVL